MYGNRYNNLVSKQQLLNNVQFTKQGLGLTGKQYAVERHLECQTHVYHIHLEQFNNSFDPQITV